MAADEPNDHDAQRMSVLPPLLVVLASAVTASLALGLGLRLLQPGTSMSAHEQALTNSPEHAAEAFIAAYRAGDYARAEQLASGSFARAIKAQAKREPPKPSEDGRELLLQESYVLPGDRLRLTGVLVQSTEDESSGWPISLTLVRSQKRYLVDDLSWPKGPPPRTP